MDNLLDGSFSWIRRAVLLSTTAIIGGMVVRRGIAAPNAPRDRENGFPQMPTGFTGVTPCGSYAPPAMIPSFARIAPPEEPGEPLEITGTVYRGDRKTPAS